MALFEESRAEFSHAEDSFYSSLCSSAALAALYAGTLAIPAPLEQWTGLSTGGAIAISAEMFLFFEPEPMRIIAMRKCGHSQWHAIAVPHGRALAQLTATVDDCTIHTTHVRTNLNLSKGLARRKASIEISGEPDHVAVARPLRA
ncbi:hypothetical protein ABZ069_37645 [Streptomyces microflavus]|uniref:hypothetical protein n=1 Tax=Streptomyces microflavus TaxID=1919 RepID=UPI0033BCC950